MYQQEALLDGLVLPPYDPCIAGIDEVGRGALAGPVVAAAVILPQDYDLPGLADSKTLDFTTREKLAYAIRRYSLAWSLGVVGQRTIDRINILEATFMAMAMAVSRLSIKPDLLYIDGNKRIPSPVLIRFWSNYRTDTLPGQKTIVHGDALEDVISAASIVAKSYRDALMRRMSIRYPKYGFDEHVGYGTARHMKAIALYGPCPLHRKTFRGVRKDTKEETLAREGSLFD